MKERLKKANEGLKTMNVKGKPYVMVNERIKAFRREFDEGSIITEITDHGIDYNYVVVTAKVLLDGVVKATGTAHEEKGFNMINKTSLVENAETSAIGRALGIFGIGIDDSVATGEEVEQAIAKQGRSDTNRDRLARFCRKRNISMNEVAERFGINKATTEDRFAIVLNTLMDEAQNG